MNCISCGKPIIKKLYSNGSFIPFCTRKCKSNYPSVTSDYPKQESNVDIKVVR